MSDWTTVTALARELGVSRAKLVRAIEEDSEIEGWRVESRPTTPADLELDGVTLRTKEVVRVVDDEPETGDGWHEDEGSYGSLRESLQRLVAISRGKVEGFRAAGGDGGGSMEPASISEMSQATERAEKLRQRLEELDNLYIDAATVANALASLGALFRDRMQAVPSRIADKVAAAVTTEEVRELLTAAVDEVLMEMAAATKQRMTEVLDR